MANWRAQIKVPVAVDTALRNYASKEQKKLKLVLQDLLDAGLSEISQSGTKYEFLVVQVLEESKCETFSYVVDDDYREKIKAQEHLLSGRGKQGKLFAECILFGLQKLKINW